MFRKLDASVAIVMQVLLRDRSIQFSHVLGRAVLQKIVLYVDKP